jgi:hypothetical protein
VLWLGAGRDRAVKQALLMGQVQVSFINVYLQAVDWTMRLVQGILMD